MHYAQTNKQMHYAQATINIYMHSAQTNKHMHYAQTNKQMHYAQATINIYMHSGRVEILPANGVRSVANGQNYMVVKRDCDFFLTESRLTKMTKFNLFFENVT